jgi:hypothetical protein
MTSVMPQRDENKSGALAPEVFELSPAKPAVKGNQSELE